MTAEAIAASLGAEEWQLGEIRAGLEDLDAGRVVTGEQISEWLRSWGQPREHSAPW